MNAVPDEAGQLDWRTMPLDGRVLIEASAGTGKTFNIGLIFLRLLLERQWPVERILVATFTEAAAQELRERLRGRLAQAERCLQSTATPSEQDTEVTMWLRHTFSGVDATRQALRLLQLARVDIDRAPVATIHGLCQRILRDYPLESGAPFAADKLLDETELLRECIEDFWRLRFLAAGASAGAVDETILKSGPEGLLFDVRDLLARDATMLPLAGTSPARGAVLLAAFEFCREQIPLRARRRGGQTFSMLIDAVHARVRASSAFAECLFKEFPAALIDEFQDTDRRQFEIFDRIYRAPDGVPRGLMAMIGDPKQAIYAFRGGDIAAYVHAREQATARFSLALNQRSSATLIAACNALYAHGNGGFEDAHVRYREVSASGKAERKPYAHRGAAIAQPFVFHNFRGDVVDDKGDPVETLAILEKLALEDCTASIVQLLNDPTHTIGGNPVVPGDIAVLLPQNRHVAKMRVLLREHRVPCVGSGRGSVFDTDVARELELVLYAVLNAEDERAVRGALATRLLGARCADIVRWQENAPAFEREIEMFAAWRALARTRGVQAFLQNLVERRGGVLLVAADGERVLTDLRHLGELLAEQDSAHGLEGAYAWFAAIRREGEDEETDAADARQLRIESDARRVQLMTLHAAKGLEFPIVYLPLAWRVADRTGSRKPKILHFHDAAGRALVDLGSAEFDTNLVQHFREDLQERLRLLYVALTRAVHAVHVYWVDRERAAAKAAAGEVAAIDLLIRPAQRSLGLEPGEMQLAALAQQLGGIGIVARCARTQAQFTGAATADTARVAREPLPRLRPFSWLHSFSSMARRVVADSLEPAAADESETVEVSDEERSDVEVDDTRLLELDIWRGRHFGDAVHKLLENAPADPIWPQQRAWLAARFAAQGVRPNVQFRGDAIEGVARMLDRTRSTDLGDGLRLAGLPPASRVAEFEFQFPVAVSLRRLRAICAEHGCANVISEHLSTTALNGMLTGFADLIFEYRGRYHVLDYKTNRLGLRLSDYSGVALDAAMDAHQYPLQALLYTVALHRYLRRRLPDYVPERHLGESWYLFLRAVGLGAGLGVWRRRWPVRLIETLDHAFAGEVHA